MVPTHRGKGQTAVASASQGDVIENAAEAIRSNLVVLELPQLQPTGKFRPKSNDLLPANSTTYFFDVHCPTTYFFDLLCPGNDLNLIDFIQNTTPCFD